MSLHPGDIISTGTPPGIGMGQKPEPIYLRAGNHVRLVSGARRSEPARDGEQKSRSAQRSLRISRAAFRPERPDTP